MMAISLLKDANRVPVSELGEEGSEAPAVESAAFFSSRICRNRDLFTIFMATNSAGESLCAASFTLPYEPRPNSAIIAYSLMILFPS